MRVVSVSSTSVSAPQFVQIIVRSRTTDTSGYRQFLASSQRLYATSIHVATRANPPGTSVFVRVLPLPLHGKPFSRIERRSKSLFRFRDIEGERFRLQPGYLVGHESDGAESERSPLRSSKL